ncbi:MAG: Bacterial leucyl aminopeptidase [Verrucomicrobia subdivision 3 bacterium]|nr:Bacterial leucyl aminopeptidase [Limisphaerales bacterium]MCS1414205.1 Bacterial leucyl aminopeptidase [Limisphaerales bacterium]
MKITTAVSVTCVLALINCLPTNSLQAQQAQFKNLGAALNSITSENLLEHIEILASDAYEGRGPGGVGEDLTVEYLIGQFMRFGLEPGNPNGTYIQEVPMVGIESESSAHLVLGDKKQEITYPQDYVAWTSHPNPEVTVKDSNLIFVGYGVEAPEYRWDDYKGANLKGHTLVMLVNDPQIPHPGDPSRLDLRYFKGKEMTYYGRWTYKLEMAAKKGAAAVILVHETGPAGYPYFVVINSWGRENFTLKPSPNGSNHDVPVASWFSYERARSMFDELGFDFDELKQRALGPDFAPIPLRAKVSFKLKNKIREITSKNVIAKIEGSKSYRRDQHIIITAHWDHIGINKKLKGDQIFNGALDNATGVAGLLELAEMFAGMRRPLARSILFLATTAEEQGLLGAKYYAENPFVPMNQTVANINVDGLNQWGPTRDIVVIGYGASSLDTIVEQAAKTQKRTVKGDPEAEKGYYYRSDHFQFAKKGVPALFLNPGTEYLGRASTYGPRKRAEYRNNDYHKVSDEIKDDWNLAGAVEDLRLLGRVIYRIGHEETWPTWRLGNEFLNIRQRSLSEK